MSKSNGHSNGNGNGSHNERGIRKRLPRVKNADQPKPELPESAPPTNPRDARVDNWTKRAARESHAQRDNRGRFRPAEVDPAKVAELAMLGMRESEISGLLGVDPGVIRRRFAHEFRLGKATRVLALREAQFAKAIGGDTSMLIWLGKNELKQSDKMEVNNNGLIVHEHRAVIAHMMRDPAANAAAELYARQQLALADQSAEKPDTVEIEGDDDGETDSTN